MDQRPRLLMTMHMALHPRDDVDRLQVSRKNRGRDLPILKTALTHQYNVFKTTYKSIKKDRLQPPETLLTTWELTERQKPENKKGKKNNSKGNFMRLISDISHKKMWTRLRKGNLKMETESLLLAAQKNTIRTDHFRARIDKTQQNSRRRLCGHREELINQKKSDCNILAQKEYDKTRLVG